MMSLRKWAIALSLTVFGFGFVNQTNAGFTGDTVSVSLTVHTTGSSDQNVFNNDLVTEPGSIFGDSIPNGLPTIIEWEFSLLGDKFTITATNEYNLVPAPIVFLSLTITNIDSAITGVSIIGPNTFGLSPSDISFTTDTITVVKTLEYSHSIEPGESFQTTFQVVPEASTFIMISMVASGLAGGYIVRRQRSRARTPCVPIARTIGHQKSQLWF